MSCLWILNVQWEIKSHSKRSKNMQENIKQWWMTSKKGDLPIAISAWASISSMSKTCGDDLPDLAFFFLGRPTVFCLDRARRRYISYPIKSTPPFSCHSANGLGGGGGGGWGEKTILVDIRIGCIPIPICVSSSNNLKGLCNFVIIKLVIM